MGVEERSEEPSDLQAHHVSALERYHLRVPGHWNVGQSVKAARGSQVSV